MIKTPTASQNSVIGHEGNLYVAACPGSGKTYTIGLRAKKLVEEGKKVALLSFSNIAANELLESASSNGGLASRNKIISQTLDSFAVTYVIRPFLHLITETSREIELVDNPKNFDNETENVKHQRALIGQVAVGDIFFWSQRVMEQYPWLARALAQRFDEVVIDECQDCSELQLIFIKTLKVSGLRSIVMVGDVHQSIYEFRGAVPDKVVAAVDELHLDPLNLRVNHRSNPQICELANNLLGGEQRNVASLERVSKDFDPIVTRVHEEHLPQIGSMLARAARAAYREIDTYQPSLCALAPTNGSAAKIRGYYRPTTNSLVDNLYKIAPGKHLDMTSFQHVEAELRRRVFKRMGQHMREPIIRSATLQVRNSIPEPFGTYGEWVEETIKSINAVIQSILPGAPEIPVPEIYNSVKRLQLTDVMNTRHGASVEALTYHASKGISRDAVFVLTEGQNYYEQKNGLPSQAQTIVQDIRNAKSIVSIPESLRKFYVACTRARSVLIVGVPYDFSSEDVSVFVRCGFTHIDLFR